MSESNQSPLIRALRDPLVTFLVLGALMFALALYMGEDDASYRVEIGAADIQRLTDQWSMQMRRPPSPQELRGLVDQLIKEEVYYREAKRLGLDTNDTIVRRRLVQKLTFLTEDIATAAPPDTSALEAYYQDNVDNYRLPERYTFTHRYFSADRRDDAEADARAALKDPSVSGDPFMLQRNYASRSQREIANQFGKDFAAELASLAGQNAGDSPQTDSWRGPLRSAYGWHVVQITKVEPTRVEPFAAIRTRVENDFKQAMRDTANQQYYSDTLQRYDVVLPSEPNAFGS